MDKIAQARIELAEQQIFSYIGKVVKEKREYLEMTQGQLAEKMQTTQSFISEIERGKSRMSMTTLSNLCVVLDLPLDIKFVPREPLPKTKVVQYMDSGTVHVWIGGPIII